MAKKRNRYTQSTWHPKFQFSPKFLDGYTQTSSATFIWRHTLNETGISVSQAAATTNYHTRLLFPRQRCIQSHSLFLLATVVESSLYGSTLYAYCWKKEKKTISMHTNAFWSASSMCSASSQKWRDRIMPSAARISSATPCRIGRNSYHRIDVQHTQLHAYHIKIT